MHVSPPSSRLLLARVGVGAAFAAIGAAGWWATKGGARAETASGILIVAIGGALGGVVFHYLEPFRRKGGAWRVVANVAGAMGYGVIVAVAFGLAWG